MKLAKIVTLTSLFALVSCGGPKIHGKEVKQMEFASAATERCANPSGHTKMRVDLRSKTEGTDVNKRNDYTTYFVNNAGLWTFSSGDKEIDNYYYDIVNFSMDLYSEFFAEYKETFIEYEEKFYLAKDASTITFDAISEYENEGAKMIEIFSVIASWNKFGEIISYYETIIVDIDGPTADSTYLLINDFSMTYSDK